MEKGKDNQEFSNISRKNFFIGAGSVIVAEAICFTVVYQIAHDNPDIKTPIASPFENYILSISTI